MKPPVDVAMVHINQTITAHHALLARKGIIVIILRKPLPILLILNVLKVIIVPVELSSTPSSLVHPELGVM